MRLYSGTTKSLIEDSTYNRIATKLRDAFFLEFRYQPAVAEVNSWNNSLRAVSQVFQTASLLDHGVVQPVPREGTGRSLVRLAARGLASLNLTRVTSSP